MSILSGKVLEVLSRDQIYEIHQATLEVLERTGVVIMEDEALRILEEAGAVVDYKKQHAKIPRHLVEEAIKKTPSGFTLYGSNGKYRLELKGFNTYIGQPFGLFIVDLDGKRRYPTPKDAADLYRLTDAMENLDLAGSVSVPEWESTDRFVAAVENSEKVPDVNPQADQAEELITLGSVLRGSFEELMKKPITWLLVKTKDLRKKPSWWYHVNPFSPLAIKKAEARGLLIWARCGLPIHIGPEVHAGTTGPATLAGTLVQQNAENLSGVTLAQLAADPKHRPPILYASISGITDMRTGSAVLGTAETALIQVASAQIARYYNMPCRGIGGITDSKTSDIQAGYESAVTLLMAALARINYINYSAGSVEGILTVSFEKVVLDNDLIGMIKRILRGITVDEETLAVDVINDVGPRGHYLAHPHTRKYHKKEFYYPILFNRETYEAWVRSGAKDIREAARERARKILKEHQPEPLDKDLKRELENKAKEIRKKRMRK